MMWNDGLGGGEWVVMMLAMVAFWALVVVGIVAIFRGVSRRDEGATPADTRDPQQILAERFARGEIDADEYHARLQVLRSSR